MQHQNTDSTPLLTLTVKQAARMVPCGVNAIYSLIRQKKLPTVKLTNSARQTKKIPREALIDFIKQGGVS